MFHWGHIFRGKKNGISSPVIVFESDDWGTIRMKDQHVLKIVTGINPSWVDDPYMQFDRLESNEDIECLFEVLLKHKDTSGNYACITANSIMLNPDFKAIRENEFENFIGIPFEKMINDYPDCDKVIQLQKKGIDAGIYFPQFHGREHIHVRRWLNGLKSNDSGLRKAFDFELISFHKGKKLPCVAYYMDAMNPVDESNIHEITQIVINGLNLFKQQWGFSSSTMIAPCYFWNTSMESELIASGIRGFQGLRIQKQSEFGKSGLTFKKISHKQFDRNRYGQFYLVRKAFFEPSLNEHKDWEDTCMAEISDAIMRDNVAIVCMHRLNFIGSISRANREKNIKRFDSLLVRIKKEFPDCLFMHTAKLIETLERGEA